MNEVGCYADPTVAADRLVFVCDGALWECSITGGRARTLTPRFAFIASPQLEYRTGRLAFAASNHGAMQIHVRAGDSFRWRAVTDFAEPCRALGWSADGRIAFISSADTPFRHITAGWLVDPVSRRLERTTTGALLPSWCAGRSVLACAPGVNPRYWRGYGGGAKGEIWIDDEGSGTFRRIMPVSSNVSSPVWCRERVFFVSDDDGHPNVYSCARDGSALQQHTHGKTLAAHSLASDGTQVVFCRGGDILRVTPDSAPRVLGITLSEPVRGRRRRLWPVGQSLTHVSGSPDGRTIACCAAGTLFEVPVRGAAARRVAGVDTAKWVAYLANGALLAVVAGCEDDRLLHIEGAGRRRRTVISAAGCGRVLAAATTADGRRAILANHRFELLVFDVDHNRARVLDRSPHRSIDQFDISADGSLCAYAVPLGLQRTVIRVARCDDGTVLGETAPRFGDMSPRFLADESIVFLSLQHASAARPEMVTTVNVWRAPYQPLAHCLVRLTTSPSYWSRAIPLPEGVALLRQSGAEPEFVPVSKAADPLRLWSIAADDIRVFGDAFLLSARDALLLGHHIQGNPVIQRALPAPRMLRARVDPVQRWRAAITECWRVARDEVPSGAVGARWDAVYEPYLKFVERACSNRDVVEVQNEMLGHLRISHARVAQPPPALAPAPGFLGVDVACEDDGTWSIRQMPLVDPQSTVPRGIAESALGVQVGDRLLAIDGRRLSATRSPASLLRRAGGQTIRCDVLAAAPQRRRTVTCEALDSERPVRYAAWVYDREQVVRRSSEGRVAYLHLPDVTMQTKARIVDWAWCHEGTQALIVDVRFNEGGSYGGEIAEFLARPVIARVRTRWSAARAIPAGSGIACIVVLTNRFTTSGGELLAATLQRLTAARVVGERTFGGATGNTNARRLPDGSELLLPEIQVVAPPDWSEIENRGHTPDVEVRWRFDEAAPDDALVYALASTTAMLSCSAG